MRFVVLGSDSFSGRHFCEYLSQRGDTCIEFGREYDINENQDEIVRTVRVHGPVYVVNFIAKGLVDPSWESPEDWVRTNVMSQTRLVDQLRRLPVVRYVQVSTPEVHGSGTHTERSPFNPSTPYAVTKAAMEMMLNVFHKQYRFPVVFTRSANVYGPRQRNRVIPLMIECAKSGRPFRLQGDGRTARSYINIRDVCNATRLVALNGVDGEAYNIATRRMTTLIELADLIGCKYELYPPRRGADERYELDTEKIRSLGWADQITLEEGIKELWDEK